MVGLAKNYENAEWNLAPSVDDLKTQDQLVQAAEIRVLDHIVVVKKGYFSFQEGGLISDDKS